ncbi:glucosamine-6-phosphate deaminase [Tremella mesenterica]|uniref:glucosamine-6-phosphate deaminase n=1 Tax=Tremella mesenterica TaxID=5217 RepID=A0A4Q1BFN5_TREME|nr:glucosamine-6-phosphate deaminase [Tremella mesenterica]
MPASNPQIKLVVADTLSAAKAVAQIIADQVKVKPNAVLGLPTGSTPIPVYEELVKMYQAGLIDFEQVRTFNLDEYVGLKPDHPESYAAFMAKHLFSKINIPTCQTHLLDGLTPNPESECKAYEDRLVKEGGMDLLFLGIGENGHLGFNEPFSQVGEGTRMVMLTVETRLANSRFFSAIDQVPTHALTMGLRTILSSKSIVLLAIGKKKAKAIKMCLEGEIKDEWPCSVLKGHEDVLVVCDGDAASGM